MRRGLLTWVLTAAGLAGVAGAADLYSSGGKTWDTTTANWGTDPSGPYNTATWSNATPDSAFFEGTAGTVALGENITVSNITFTALGNYTLSGNTLNFVSGAAIDSTKDRVQTITSGITGSPTVRIAVSSHNPYNQVVFAPNSIDQTLGEVVLGYEDGSGDKCLMTLGGTTTGNTVGNMAFPSGHQYGVVEKVGSGTWTIADVSTGIFNVSDGNLICNGSIRTYYGGLSLAGGVFHYNNAAAVASGGFSLNNGSFDNSSGAAITTSTYNPAQTWGGNWTFIGSNGANSDLNLGTGAVTLTGTRTVTIQNAATTLTVGGAVGDVASVWGLTKDGAGTLKFTGANTYNGATTVNAGTLSLGNGTANTALDNDAAVSIASGATLDLNFTGSDTVFALFLNGVLQPAGTYDSTTPGGYITGSGSLVAGDGTAPAGIYYWDGPNVGGDGDNLSDGGSGIWSTSNANWDHGYGARQVWPNTTADKAIFRKAAGTVDLQSDVTLGEILIDGVDNYVIGGTAEDRSLHFGGAANIFVNGVHAEFKAGITGSPDLQCGANHRKIVKMTADAASQTLGTVTFGAGATSNPEFWIQGTNTESSATAIVSPFTYSFVQKNGTGTWTVGNVSCGVVYLNAGKLVANGTVTTGWSDFKFNGGTLAGTGTINNENVTVPVTGTIAPGDPTGTLTIFNKDCTINGTMRVEIDAAQLSPNGTLAVDNTLTLGATSVLDVNVTGAAGGKMTIATFGTLSGSFGTENLPAGWTIDYAANGGTAITLTGMPSGTLIVVR